MTKINYKIYRTQDDELVSNYSYTALEDATAEALEMYNLDCKDRGEGASDYDVVRDTDLEVVYTTALDGYFINKV